MRSIIYRFFLSCCQLVEEHGEKYVTLIRSKHLQIVAEKLLIILEAAPGKQIPLDNLNNVFMKSQGYALCFEDFQMNSMKELVSRLPRLIRIESICFPRTDLTVCRSETHNQTDKLSEMDPKPDPHDGTNIDKLPSNDILEHKTLKPEEALDSGPHFIEYACLADRTQIKHLAHKVLLLLLDTSNGILSTSAFSERFRYTFRDEPNMELIRSELDNIVEVRLFRVSLLFTINK